MWPSVLQVRVLQGQQLKCVADPPGDEQGIRYTGGVVLVEQLDSCAIGGIQGGVLLRQAGGDDGKCISQLFGSLLGL